MQIKFVRKKSTVTFDTIFPLFVILCDASVDQIRKKDEQDREVLQKTKRGGRRLREEIQRHSALKNPWKKLKNI